MTDITSWKNHRIICIDSISTPIPIHSHTLTTHTADIDKVDFDAILVPLQIHTLALGYKELECPLAAAEFGDRRENRYRTLRLIGRGHSKEGGIGAPRATHLWTVHKTNYDRYILPSPNFHCNPSPKIAMTFQLYQIASSKDQRREKKR